MLLSGAALVIFGAGLILTTPAVRKLLGGVGIGSLLQAAGPDFQRYLKLEGNVTTPNPTTPPLPVYVLDPGLSSSPLGPSLRVCLPPWATTQHSRSGNLRVKRSSRAETPEQASVRIVVQSGSLELTDQVSDKDRREIERTTRNEVLETSRFPEIIFEASNPSMSKGGEGHYWANITGKLTIRGMTQTAANHRSGYRQRFPASRHRRVHCAAVQLRDQARLGGRRHLEAERRRESDV